MNGQMIRFEALRFFRQPRVWLLAVLFFAVANLLVVVLPGDAIIFTPLGQSVLFSLLLGYMVPSAWQAPQAETTALDAQYVLSRMGTRRELLVARWAFALAVGVVLWSALVAGLGARGQLSARSTVDVHGGTVALLEQAGHAPIFERPRQQERYLRWDAAGRPDAPEWRHYRVRMEAPWLLGAIVLVTFLAFLVGAASQSVGGPSRLRWEWSLFREPEIYLRYAPLLAACLLMLSPFFGDSASALTRQEQIFAQVYVHPVACSVAGAASIALFGALSLRSWKRADLL